MPELVAWDFCRATKLHLDAILSEGAAGHQQEIDVGLIIETMQMTIEFENDLQRRYSKETAESS